MKKIDNTTIEEIREFCDRGCDYAGTQEFVHDVFCKAFEENGGIGDWDELQVYDLEENPITLQDLFESFYDKILDGILNVIETQEVSNG